MDFGTIVADLRKEKKISQTDLANRLGIHKNVLGRYERNEVLPSIDIARKIADILEVSLDYLVGNTDTVLEKDLLKKITDIQKLPGDKKKW